MEWVWRPKQRNISLLRNKGRFSPIQFFIHFSLFFVSLSHVFSFREKKKREKEMADITVLFGAKGDVPHETRDGHLIDEAVSSLRYSLRSGLVFESRYWSAQLDMAGLGETVWNILILFTYTDVGLSMPISPVCAAKIMRAWYACLEDNDLKPGESWKSSECRSLLLTMAAYASCLPKNGMVRNCNSVAIMSNKGGLDPVEDWNVKLGTNRKASAILKPVTDNHHASVRKAVTCLYRAITAEDEWNSVRIGDLLSEWGHTSIVWEVVEKLCCCEGFTEYGERFSWCGFYIKWYQSTWYWSTRGKDQWPDGITSDLYCDTVPVEWKARHGQDVHIISSRAIWVQAVMLMVRGSQATFAMMNYGQIPEECTPKEEIVECHYASNSLSGYRAEGGEEGWRSRDMMRRIRMNTRSNKKKVPDMALNMFTVSGRKRNRGIVQYFESILRAYQNSGGNSATVSEQDMYAPLAINMYTMEEQVFGPCLTNDVDIVARRVNSGSLEKGLIQEDPRKKTTTPTQPLSTADGIYLSRLKRKKMNGENYTFIDVNDVIGLATKREGKASRKGVEDTFQKEVTLCQQESGVLGAKEIFCEDVEVERGEMPETALAGLLTFRGKLLDGSEAVAWGPMSVNEAEYALSSVWMEKYLIALAIRPSGASSIPKDIGEFVFTSTVKDARNKGSFFVLPSPCGGDESILEGFYSDGGGEWEKSGFALAFLLYNILRWMEIQTPVVGYDRMRVCGPKEDPFVWICACSVSILDGEEDNEGYGERKITVDGTLMYKWDYLRERIAMRYSCSVEAAEQWRESDAWWTQKQTQFISDKLERAMGHWEATIKRSISRWKRCFSSRGKERTAKRMREFSKVGSKDVVSSLIGTMSSRFERLLALDSNARQKLIVEWIVNRGFKIHEKQLDRFLPLEKFT
jgi:hypothetical protein